MLKKINILLSNILYFDNKLNRLFLYTIITALLIKLTSFIIKFITKKRNLTEKQIYTFHKRTKTTLNIIFIILLTIIWKDLLGNAITFISFISAAITLAARDIIFNYFCGIYIKITKPIQIEDRIKIGDYTGDIININNLNFELLEVDPETNQSTGIIIHLPNSLIFNTPLKNYNKAFKYVWDELTIRINADSDIELAKKILLKIVTSNSIIKEIPKKMKKEIEQSISKYRLYYNNYSPIIYTKLNEDKCYLTIRFLIHPKKQRTVESELYNNIIKLFKRNNISMK